MFYGTCKSVLLVLPEQPEMGSEKALKRVWRDALWFPQSFSWTAMRCSLVITLINAGGFLPPSV